MSSSWSQVLNDVTSRLSAASQTLQNLEPKQYRPASSSFSNEHAGSPVYTDSESSSSAMSVRVQLDERNAPYYSNLDLVSGRVMLNLVTDTAVSAINVKLEGETRTRLIGPKFLNDPKNRQKIEQEVHKVLYKVQTVFPSANIAPDVGSNQYTLPAGHHTWSFALKIPINNDCTNNSRIFQDLRLGNFPGNFPGSESASNRHVRQTLPPTLTGFPGEAEIKYFVKVTVVRPKFYQENLRTVNNIVFLPIEPPRPPRKAEVTYARRTHQFQQVTPARVRKTSIFSTTPSMLPEEIPLAIKVEARLPSPAILTCHQPLPLRVMIEKTNDSSASVYLSLLQIELIGVTNIRAQDLGQPETRTWVIMSQANMNLQLDNPTDRSSRLFEIPPRLWDNVPLPNTIAPTFTACNISRSYELEVRIGVSHGMADGIRPELIVLPLRLPVEVYSGIAPPEQLLQRINTQKASSSNLTPSKANHIPHQPSPITPIPEHIPTQSGSYMAPPMDDPNDLPPSYEDAMAEDIVPVDGPRRDFNSSGTTPIPPSPSAYSDSKNSSGLNRHPSERLFSQNAPTPPGVTPQTTSNPQTVDPDVASVSNHLTGFDMNQTPTSSRPPPLPARKGTVDSVSGQKKN